MPTVKLFHNDKEYQVDQKTLDIWQEGGIRFKVVEKGDLEKPNILKQKISDDKDQS